IVDRAVKQDEPLVGVLPGHLFQDLRHLPGTDDNDVPVALGDVGQGRLPAARVVAHLDDPGGDPELPTGPLDTGIGRIKERPVAQGAVDEQRNPHALRCGANAQDRHQGHDQHDDCQRSTHVRRSFLNSCQRVCPCAREVGARLHLPHDRPCPRGDAGAGALSAHVYAVIAWTKRSVSFPTSTPRQTVAFGCRPLSRALSTAVNPRARVPPASTPTYVCTCSVMMPASTATAAATRSHSTMPSTPRNRRVISRSGLLMVRNISATGLAEPRRRSSAAAGMTALVVASPGTRVMGMPASKTMAAASGSASTLNSPTMLVLPWAWLVPPM